MVVTRSQSRKMQKMQEDNNHTPTSHKNISQRSTPGSSARKATRSPLTDRRPPVARALNFDNIAVAPVPENSGTEEDHLYELEEMPAALPAATTIPPLSNFAQSIPSSTTTSPFFGRTPFIFGVNSPWASITPASTAPSTPWSVTSVTSQLSPQHFTPFNSPVHANGFISPPNSDADQGETAQHSSPQHNFFASINSFPLTPPPANFSSPRTP